MRLPIGSRRRPPATCRALAVLPVEAELSWLPVHLVQSAADRLVHSALNAQIGVEEPDELRGGGEKSPAPLGRADGEANRGGDLFDRKVPKVADSHSLDVVIDVQGWCGRGQDDGCARGPVAGLFRWQREEGHHVAVPATVMLDAEDSYSVLVRLVILDVYTNFVAPGRAQRDEKPIIRRCHVADGRAWLP